MADHCIAMIWLAEQSTSMLWFDWLSTNVMYDGRLMMIYDDAGGWTGPGKYMRSLRTQKVLPIEAIRQPYGVTDT